MPINESELERLVDALQHVEELTTDLVNEFADLCEADSFRAYEDLSPCMCNIYHVWRTLDYAREEMKSVRAALKKERTK